MRTDWLLSLGTASVVLTAQMSAQVVEKAVRGQRPSCQDCSISLEKVTVIGGANDTLLSGYPGGIARTVDGFVIVVERSLGRPIVFDRSGKFIRMIGRHGAGPGEFQRPMLPIVDRQGQLHILDPVLNRHSVWSLGGSLIRESAIAPVPGALSDAKVLKSGELVVAMAGRDAESAGYPLQIVKLDGRQRRMLEPEVDYDIGRDWRLVRHLHVATDGRLLAVDPFNYKLFVYSPDGKLEQIVQRVGSWFHPIGPNEEPQAGFGVQPPTNSIAGLWEDAAGGIWLVGLTASPRWRPGTPEKVVDISGIHRNYQTMIEVLDIEAGHLIASGSLDGMVVTALGEGAFASSRETDGGFPEITVWKAVLQRR